jgi:hypothetical protein
MAREGKGRIVSQGRAQTRYLTIPASVAADSNFPFGDGETVIVKIDDTKQFLIVEKIT